MKRLIVVGLLGLMVSWFMIAVPASANSVHTAAGLRLTVTRAGDLLINGDGANNSVIIVEGDNPDEFGFIIDGDLDDEPDLSLVVSRNIRANLGGGADKLTVTPGVSLPGGLTVATGPAGAGTDEIMLNGATIPGVTSLRFVGAGNVWTGETVFGGTVVIRGGNGDFQVCDGVCSESSGRESSGSESSGSASSGSASSGSDFQKNLRINSGRRGSFVVRTAQDTRVAVRMTIIGGAQGAELNLSGDLGLNPVLRTLNGDDRWIIDEATWAGKLRGITSTGDDTVSLINPQNDDGPLLFNVNLGRGDDSIGIDLGFDPVSRANGTSGDDEACDLSGVLLGTFETVLTESCSPSHNAG